MNPIHRAYYGVDRFILLALLCSLWGCSTEADEDDPFSQVDSGEADIVDVFAPEVVHEDVDSGDTFDIELGPLDIEEVQEDVEEDTGPKLPPEPWDVTEAGPYKVAYVMDELTYTPRSEGAEARTLRVAIWYPTSAESGRSARYYGIMHRGPVLAGTPPAHDQPMPTLVFSHGSASMAEQSYFMTEFFASHGWLVIAPDHTGNTFTDSNAAIDLESGLYRPQDITATIDFLHDLPVDHMLHGLVSDDLVVSGHSFGGYTAVANSGATFEVDAVLESCTAGEDLGRYCGIFAIDDLSVFREGFHDERVKVSIPQTPAGAELFNLDGVTPTLLWTGSRDTMVPNQTEGDRFWELLSGPEHMRIDLTTAAHFTFSNLCQYFGTLEPFLSEGCGPDSIRPSEVFTVVNAYSLAFARHHLFGDDSHLDLLDGSRLLTQDMVVSRKDD